MIQLNKETIKNPSIDKLTDKTYNGHCSSCGECCSRFIPVSKKERKEILRYCKKENIVLSLSGVPLKLEHAQYYICPFRNIGTQNCAIYPVRPNICKSFICNQPEKSIRNKEMYLKRYEVIDMFDILEECMS